MAPQIGGGSTARVRALSFATMTRLSLSVPDDLGEWAEARAAEAQLEGAGAYLTELLRRDRDEAHRLAQLRTAIDEGLASGVSDRDPFEYLDELRAGLRRTIGSADAA